MNFVKTTTYLMNMNIQLVQCKFYRDKAWILNKSFKFDIHKGHLILLAKYFTSMKLCLFILHLIISYSPLNKSISFKILVIFVKFIIIIVLCLNLIQVADYSKHKQPVCKESNKYATRDFKYFIYSTKESCKVKDRKRCPFICVFSCLDFNNYICIIKVIRVSKAKVWFFNFDAIKIFFFSLPYWKEIIRKNDLIFPDE